MDVSIVVPAYNEAESVPLLYQAVCNAMAGLNLDWELLVVNDGSTDDTERELNRLADEDVRIRPIHLRRNYGQTAALAAGFELASGEIIVTLDADLQNDPADIPMMLDKLDEGYDLVHGRRVARQDGWWHRKLPSRIANWLISRVTGFPETDLGCTLKAIRIEIARDLELYGEMHRFIPILARWHGARCVEVPTRHHARRFGVTKYGLSRTWGVLLDLWTVNYWIRYSVNPMRYFGSIGLGAIGLALLSGLATLGMKLGWNFDVSGNPLLYVHLFSILAGIQFFSLGALSETASRTYFESQGRTPYAIRSTQNFAPQRHVA